MLIKRRGKAGLLALNKTWDGPDGAKEWIKARAGKPVKVRVSHFFFEKKMNKFTQVEHTTGTLTTFIVEPFLPHPSNTEYYICVTSGREGDAILFTHEGGVDIGDVDSKALRLSLPVSVLSASGTFPTRATIQSTLLSAVPSQKSKDALTDFILRLYAVYVHLHFTYLEINPLVCLDGGDIQFLDMAAKVDQTAESICGPMWAVARDLTLYEESFTGAPKTTKKVGGVQADRGPPMVFPAPFGRQLTTEEAYIQKLDASTGASLKLTVLNAKGRIWTMVAGGGASVVYSDAIAAHGFAGELANYGEYSGAPTEGQTYEYARTVSKCCLGLRCGFARTN
jgi:ATP citrate (pro-S)-lyase